MLNATQPTPATARSLRRPTTGSTPLVGPNTGGSVGPVSAELPVVEPGPVAGVTASPWETPPVPRNPASRPPEARGGPRSGEVPVLDDRFDNFVPRGTPPRGEQPVTTRVDLERDFERPPPSPLQEPPHRGRASAGPGPGPGTMTRRPSYDDRYDDEHDDYDDEYDDRDEHDDDFDGSERQGCGRLAVPLVVVAVVLCIALVTAAVWARRQINPGGAPGPTVSVDVVSGQSTSDIGDALEKADVITSASVWTWYVRLRGGGDVQAGTYEMHKNMSMGDALDELTSGPLPPDARKVTVAEGWTTRELVSKLTSGDGAVEGFTAEGVQQALVDPALRSQYLPAEQTNVEGTLFPETYNISEDATPAELVEKMVDQFDATVGELDLTGNAERLGYPPYEVLIIASLIEEEAKLPEERAQVARVIYNRLGQDIALGIDATTCYDLDQTPCRPTSAELNSDSPYNTRQAKGLPPTPISSPGRASIEAALHPAEGPWIYYVLKDAEGHHTFTDSTEEFNQAKQACHDANLGCG
ncbi:MAG TPA: endolytic transglycosylase MltG [Acidimicrobiales bacterium]|nr:endolytic transglycosylase MltG [Acidimicrobiales bacterium]